MNVKAYESNFLILSLSDAKRKKLSYFKMEIHTEQRVTYEFHF